MNNRIKRKRAKAYLRKHEERFQTLYNKDNELVEVSHNGDGYPIFASGMLSKEEKYFLDTHTDKMFEAYSVLHGK